MQTVYVVMTGGADRDLHAIFTDETKAEEYQAFACPGGWVDHWSVDKEKVPEWFQNGLEKFQGYWAQLHYSDRVLFSVAPCVSTRAEKDWEYEPVHATTFDDGSRQAWTEVWAKDREEALRLLIEKLGAAGYVVTDKAKQEVLDSWKGWKV